MVLPVARKSSLNIFSGYAHGVTRHTEGGAIPFRDPAVRLEVEAGQIRGYIPVFPLVTVIVVVAPVLRGQPELQVRLLRLHDHLGGGYGERKGTGGRPAGYLQGEISRLGNTVIPLVQGAVYALRGYRGVVRR